MVARDKYIKVKGINFHYREWGNADAPPLLLLHGLTGHAWEFDSVAKSLSDRFHVIVMNQRGHGETSWAEEYSPSVMAGDVAAFIDGLGLKSVYLAGHSMGGVNGWWFAAQYPEKIKRLVILDVEPNVVTSGEIVAAWENALNAYAEARYDNQEEAVKEYLSGNSGAHQKELRRFVLNNLKKDESGNRWMWRFDAAGLTQWMHNASVEKETLWSKLKDISCPTLILKAADSPFTDFREMEKMTQKISDSQLVVISDSGHDIHIDQRDALIKELRHFLLAENYKRKKSNK